MYLTPAQRSEQGLANPLGDLLVAGAALSVRFAIYSRHEALSGFKSIDCLLKLGAKSRLGCTSKISLGERNKARVSCRASGHSTYVDMEPGQRKAGIDDFSIKHRRAG